MKYKTSILTLLSLSAMAEGHWYAGAGVGGTTINSTVYGQEHTTPSTAYYMPDVQKLSKHAWAGQLQGGYLRNFNTYFAMGEVFTNFSNNEATDKGVYTNDAAPNQLLISTISKTRTIGLSGKLGAYIAEKWGMFASLSLLHGHFKFKRAYSDPNPTYNKTSKNQKSLWGMAPGIGAIYKPTAKTMVRLEYNYEMYQTLKANQFIILGTTDSPIPGAPTYLDAKVNPHYHTIMLSLSYEF